MADTFNVGDTVQLKSGGPIMTVTYFGPDQFGASQTVQCMWFVGPDQRTGQFPPGALNKAQ